MADLVSRDAWKALGEEKRKATGLRKFGVTGKAKLTEKLAASIGVEFKERSFIATSSSDVSDRYGDIIRVPGWETDGYFAAGSPVQWAHDMRGVPIGTTLMMWKETGKPQGKNRLRTVRHFHGQTALSQEVYALVDADILRASSVGFRPLEVRDLTDEEGRWMGFDFVRQELYEDSVVPVPANPDALVGLKSAHDSFPAYREELERAIEEGLYGKTAQGVMQKAHGILGPSRKFSFIRTVDEDGRPDEAALEAFRTFVKDAVKEALAEAEVDSAGPGAGAPGAGTEEGAEENAGDTEGAEDPEVEGLEEDPSDPEISGLEDDSEALAQIEDEDPEILDLIDDTGGEPAEPSSDNDAGTAGQGENQ